MNYFFVASLLALPSLVSLLKPIWNICMKRFHTSHVLQVFVMNDVAWPTLIDSHPDVKPAFEFFVPNVAVLDKVVWPAYLVTYPDSCVRHRLRSRFGCWKLSTTKFWIRWSSILHEGMRLQSKGTWSFPSIYRLIQTIDQFSHLIIGILCNQILMYQLSTMLYVARSRVDYWPVQGGRKNILRDKAINQTKHSNL